MMNFKKITSIVLATCISIGVIGCGSQETKSITKDYDGRVFYEIFIRAFNDSDGDGIGDLNGVTQKLDYLEELGVGGVWLMPINPSPSYHGYDVLDYKAINEEYGTMEDFQMLLDEAEKRDIKVYMDMVINHSSIEHPWFKDAVSNKDSEYRDYYLWTEDEEVAKETSPMGGGSPWHKEDNSDAYHYGLFWSGMPDLNLDDENLKKELFDIAKFYIDMGVDGFRMDAVKWFHNDIESTNEFTKEYSDYCKSLDENFKLVGEVWDNTYAMAKYQESLDSFFDFSLGDMIIESLNNNTIERLPEKIKRNYNAYTSKNENFVVAPFLSNHDQARIMNSLSYDEDKMKMAAAIYLTLPGTPYVYYGEETGMTGKGEHENVREPFIWSNEDLSLNSSWRESQNDPDKIAVNVQEKDEGSLYNFYKSIINTRNNTNSLKFGEIDFVKSDDKSVMVMQRSFEEEISYVIINTSNDIKNIALDKGKLNVLYSNNGKTEKVDTNNIELKGSEILILK